jgi:hypothetical protein
MLILRVVLIAIVTLGFGAGSAQALPSLQLGEGTVGNWEFDNGSETWVVTDTKFELIALANADKAYGGDGEYAWDDAGAEKQVAYLVASAAPKMDSNGFVLEVKDSGGVISMMDSGYGTPPIGDPNSLAPHGIFDTYFEIYQFHFDGAIETIYNTQPGGSGTGEGYLETLMIEVKNIAAGVDGVHFDLMTLTDDGYYDVYNDGGIVNSFAPFSHDAEYDDSPGPGPMVPVPEPTSAVLFLAGALIVGRATRRVPTKTRVRA